MRIAALIAFVVLPGAPAFAQVDLTGTWARSGQSDNVDAVEPVDLLGMPLNADGRAKALSYDIAALSATERQCQMYPPFYTVDGPFPLQISLEQEPVTQKLLAWKIAGWGDRDVTMIWMDGRPHPSQYAPHPHGGFTTGTWEGDTLTTVTTHFKLGDIKRHRGFSSDRATLTMRFNRHGDILTVTGILEDPVYLATPYVLTEVFRLTTTPNFFPLTACEPIEELPRLHENPEIAPHYLPGKHPAMNEVTEKYNIPLEAVLGGPETMYPEYRRTLKDAYVLPPPVAAKPRPRPPEFTVDPTWPTIPNNWVLGEVTSISVDGNDNIWVLHVPQSVPEAQRANAAPPVLQFDATGKLLTSWGGPRDGAEWLGREHGIFVDANDFVWIAGRAGWPRATTPGVSDDMIMKFTMAGERVLQIGRSGQSTGNLDTENVHQATDVYVDTQATEVYAADGYGNKRVIVFDSETGKFKRMWGAFGNPPPSTFAPNAPAPQPQTTPDGPPEFGLPHAIKVSHDGVVYLADRINNRIQMFTREGKFLKQVRVTNEGSTVVPVPAGFAFSPDQDQQFLYVVDSGPMRVVIFDRQTMTQIGVVGEKGANAGEFDIVHHIAADSKGNLYTAEIVNNRRAQKFVLTATP